MRNPLSRIADEIDSFLEAGSDSEKEPDGVGHGDAGDVRLNAAAGRQQPAPNASEACLIGRDVESLRSYLSLLQAQIKYLSGIVEADQQDAAKPRHEIACADGESFDALIQRAGMNMGQYYGGDIAATDGTGTLSVGYHHNQSWDDCIAVAVNREGERSWLVNHLSPARARVAASHLLRLAEQIERDKGELPEIDGKKNKF